MGIFYDAGARKWNVTREQENIPRLRTDYPTGDQPISVSVSVYDSPPPFVDPDAPFDPTQRITRLASYGIPRDESGNPLYSTREIRFDVNPKDIERSGATSVIIGVLRSLGVNVDTNAYGGNVETQDLESALSGIANPVNQKAYEINYYSNRNRDLNENNRVENEKIQKQENENRAKNAAYDRTMQAVNSTRGGDYVQQRDLIRGISGVSDDLKRSIEDNFKRYYSTEKLQPWSTSLGAKPPYGDFDSNFYRNTYPDVADAWRNAVRNDDLDILGRFDSEGSFYLYHYTAHGRYENRRANPAEQLSAANSYTEKRPTDLEMQQARDLQLGEGLQGEVELAIGERTLKDVKKFKALTQDVLKETIAEMKKAKAKEQELTMFSGFGAFSEITNLNKDLANSILGDSGVGGVWSFLGGNKGQESLEKSLQGISGINNSVTYNWQQWFDNALKTRYDEEIQLGLDAGTASENLKIEGQFARKFLDTYLIPRFNQSKSMNEFVDYIDVKEDEQNPFQTQDLANAAKQIADLKATQYLNEIQNAATRYFNADFYINPTGNIGKQEAYSEQARTVQGDWEAAKRGDPYWVSQAYRFGVDVNNKEQFAKMHYQIKGQGRGYDSAEDYLNAGKINDFIYNDILPAVKNKVENTELVFGPFLLPEEFADEMLKGLNPDDKTTWEDVLKRYGLTDFKGTIDDLRAYIIEALRTGSAQEIRENIKYLNEKRQKPTQELLGVTYIERPEDYKPDATIKADTELYKIFQSSGFQGTEDEFYENFFPDIDRSEQIALTKAGRNEALKTTGLDLETPYASLDTLESFFDTGTEDTEKTSEPSTSYFKINLDEELPGKSKSGQGFLDEFTSLFKGFS